MQASQVKERFPSVARTIDSAAQLCQITSDVPDEVRACVDRLGQESDEARNALAEEMNDNHIIQIVDRLEKLGDRAIHACRQAGHVNEQVQTAVQQAHDAIAALKHRLH